MFDPFVEFAAETVSESPCALPSQFADRQRQIMADALESGDARAYQRARRSLRAHYRYHAPKFRDGSSFPISHDDHLANTAHQSSYHGRGDVERMAVGLTEPPKWQPKGLRIMDQSVERVPVSYNVPGVGLTVDWVTPSQLFNPPTDPDADELPSDFTLSSLAEAERLECSVEELDEGMRARKTR